MGMRTIVDMCSHLSNCSKAHLGLTSVPLSKFNLSLALALHRSGFLSFITRGGPTPPDPSNLSSHTAEPLTTANVASQRLWVGLKYHNNEPVLRKCSNISTPTRQKGASLEDLGFVVRGLNSGGIKGLGMGECLFLKTKMGVFEARECLERRTGGVLLCKVW